MLRHEHEPDIILIHGSWHWGGCFNLLQNELRMLGHNPTAVDLAAHGKDQTNVHAIRSMDDYVAPVSKILEKIDKPTLLVGHSMGGVTLSFLAEHYPEQISGLIYIAGFMTPNGLSAEDYLRRMPANTADAKAFSELVSPVPAGRSLDIDNISTLKHVFFHDCSEELVHYAQSNLNQVTSSVPDKFVSSISNNKFGKLPRLYIKCEHDKAIPLSVQEMMINDVPGCDIEMLPTSHSPFFSAPEHLALMISQWKGNQ